MRREHVRHRMSRLVPGVAVAAYAGVAALVGCTHLFGGAVRVPVFDGRSREEQGQLARRLTQNKGRVPGWYDEQRLAVGTAGNLRHGALARIIPSDDLERYTTGTFTDRWVFVAAIDADAPYAKLGLGRTTPGGAPNRLDLMFRTSDRQWIARVTTPAGDSTRYRVTRDPHPLDPVPGSARWVWRENDEGAWVMCGSGCCTTGDALT